MFQRTCFGVVLSLVCAAALAGCAKKPAETTAEGEAAASASAQAAPAAAGGGEMTPESTIVEESDQGTITWSITTDGRFEAVVKDPQGKVVDKDVTGVVVWPGEAADYIEYVTQTPEGHLVGQGLALDADLTEIDYDLVIGGKAWSGVLHVPRGGTRAIAEDAPKAEADDNAPGGPGAAGKPGAGPAPAGRKGPNGGVIQVIGGETVELVADKDTGEVRVFVLGPDYKPIEPGERRMRLGYVADDVEMLDLEREPGTLYYVGRVRTRVDPVRVTLAVGVGASVHVGIIGFHAGMHLGVGVGAPVIPIMVARAWTPSVHVGIHVGVGCYAGVYGGYGYGGFGVRERVAVGTRVNVRERVDVNVHGHVKVDERVRVHEHGDRGEHRGHGEREHDRGDRGHHDNGVRDHGRGEGRGGPAHGGGRGAPSHGGGRGGGRKH
ncbi:MAG: hypothetical protein QM820_41925 [Minicystis sp.]